MQYSPEQFTQIMANVSIEAKEAVSLFSGSQYHRQIIDYIKDMPIDKRSFEITQYLIKRFRTSILYCFQPFYTKVAINLNGDQKFKQQIMRIASLVNDTIKKKSKVDELKSEGKKDKDIVAFHELFFFKIRGIAQKAWDIHEQTPQEQQFIRQVQFIRGLINIKKTQPLLNSIPNIDIQTLREKPKSNKFNVFQSYYLTRLIQDLQKIYKFQILIKIQATPNTKVQVKGWDGKVTTSCPAVFRAQKLPAVYVLIDNQKCHIPNPDCYNRIFKNWDIIVPLDKEAVNKIPTGKGLGLDATLIKEKNSQVIYFINNKEKRRIKSNEYLYYGFKKEVQECSKYVIQNLKTGRDLCGWSDEIH